MPQNQLFHITRFVSYNDSVPKVLDAVGADRIFSEQDHILLKPNLVNDSAFPVTTSPDCCKAVINYIQNCSSATISIAEGCGDAYMDTDEVYERLGYTRLAQDADVELIDLNTADLTMVENSDNSIFPAMFLPKIIFNTFIISLPVLKAHSLAGITCTLKNMMGAAPPKHYSGDGFWKKSLFHEHIQESIVELNRFRTPDLTLLDATIGLADYHLGGPTCRPPVGKMVVSDNPQKIDQCAATLLGFDPDTILHINKL